MFDHYIVSFCGGMMGLSWGKVGSILRNGCKLQSMVNGDIIGISPAHKMTIARLPGRTF